jgi:hypothetical protein
MGFIQNILNVLTGRKQKEELLSLREQVAKLKMNEKQMQTLNVNFKKQFDNQIKLQEEKHQKKIQKIEIDCSKKVIEIEATYLKQFHQLSEEIGRQKAPSKKKPVETPASPNDAIPELNQKIEQLQILNVNLKTQYDLKVKMQEEDFRQQLRILEDEHATLTQIRQLKEKNAMLLQSNTNLIAKQEKLKNKILRLKEEKTLIAAPHNKTRVMQVMQKLEARNLEIEFLKKEIEAKTGEIKELKQKSKRNGTTPNARFT